MSDFGKGFIAGSFLSGDGGGSSNGDGCFALFKMILFLVAIGIVGFIVVFIISVGTVLQDMGVMWYVGLLFFAGVWDLYIPIELTSGMKLLLLPLVLFIAYAIFNGIMESGMLGRGSDDYAVPRFKNKMVRWTLSSVYGIANFVVVIALLMILVAFPVVIARSAYYLFVIIF